MDQSTLHPGEPVARGDAQEKIPGIALVFTNGAPTAVPIPFSDGALEIGRAETCAARLDDRLVSRRHARVRFDGRRFTAVDLSSQNGTFVDGEAVPSERERVVHRTIRVGDSLLVPLDDMRPLEQRGVRTVASFVRGPAMQVLLDEISRAAQIGSALHIHGESGTGKEGVAQAFHRAGARASGPFVAVNCATIPQNLAERLLFGAKRGAYSGAEADSIGYLQEADRGTLFLDEIAELEPSVQAKLLRTTETGDVVPLGAARGRKVDVRLCSATNADLRALVAAGKMRQDLYFRIGRPEVRLPALRDRPEEIAFLIRDELRRSAPTIEPHVSLVEQCLLRQWPGNIRELLAEVRAAAQSAASQREPRASGSHLSPGAGNAFGAPSADPITPPTSRPAARAPEYGREALEEALRQNGGNVSACARALGLHRTQLRRLIERHQIFVGSDPEDQGGEH
jgi:DNA-binding NtrC family response regulator